MLQANIAIERIDERLKPAFDRSAARCTANLEIGNVHRAMCFDLGQCSPEIVVRGEHAVDASKNAEVGGPNLEVPGTGVRPGWVEFQGPKWPRDWISPGGNALRKATS